MPLTMPLRKLSPNHKGRLWVKAKVTSSAAPHITPTSTSRTGPKRAASAGMRWGAADHADAPHRLDQADGDVVDAAMLERQRDQRHRRARLHAIAQAGEVDREQRPQRHARRRMAATAA